MTKKELEQRVESLEAKIKELEARPSIVVNFPPRVEPAPYWPYYPQPWQTPWYLTITSDTTNTTCTSDDVPPTAATIY